MLSREVYRDSVNSRYNNMMSMVYKACQQVEYAAGEKRHRRQGGPNPAVTSMQVC